MRGRTLGDARLGLLGLVAASLFFWGCECGSSSDPADGGLPDDAASALDGGVERDAAGDDDAAVTPEDGAVGREDGAVVPDDAEVVGDGSVDVDGCAPVLCPAPPDGCRYVADPEDPCGCGTLDCEDADCRTNADCADRETCSGEGCGTPGTCVRRPDVCPAVYMPVCGCDGTTYGNGCTALSHGVRVDYAGECTTTGPECETNADCHDEDYCAGEGCRGAGRCERRPGACPAVYDPVCGCDGLTYGNACNAASAGMRVQHEGACRTTPTEPCAANSECGPAEFCAADSCAAWGTCQLRPTVCSSDRAPVCGCDAVTYGNRCEAERAGARVSHEGECDTSSGGCARPCPDGTYCTRCWADWACVPVGAAC